jgi:hypothetical protein
MGYQRDLEARKAKFAVESLVMWQRFDSKPESLCQLKRTLPGGI